MTNSTIGALKRFLRLPLAAEDPDHEFLDASYVIDIHRLPEDLRKLAIFLMLDRLYAEIMSLTDPR